MSTQYINGIYNNATSASTTASENWVISNFVPVNSTLISNNNMYVRYDQIGGQYSSGSSTTVLQFNTATTSVNASGLTVSGTNNTTFTNTSGSSQYWIICGNISGTNQDVVTQKMGIKIYINGASLIGNSFYNPTGDAISITVTTPLLVNNNDALTIVFVQTGTAAMSIGTATLFIKQV
jgi:hypothetical protein